MSLDINVWSNVKVAIQTLLGTAKTITAITKADPAVVTSAAHGLTDGKLGLLKVKGMREVNYMVVRVANQDTNTFELEGVDSTDFGTFVSGTFEEITFGAESAVMQELTPSGGEAAGIAVEVIHTDDTYEVPGRRSPLVISCGALWDPADPALVAMRGFDRTKTPGCVAVEFATGNKIYFAAYMSAPLTPAGAAGAVVSTPASMRVRGPLTIFEV